MMTTDLDTSRACLARDARQGASCAGEFSCLSTRQQSGQIRNADCKAGPRLHTFVLRRAIDRHVPITFGVHMSESAPFAPRS